MEIQFLGNEGLVLNLDRNYSVTKSCALFLFMLRDLFMFDYLIIFTLFVSSFSGSSS